MCPVCRYDTVGVVAGRCPECSTPTGTFLDIRRRARRGSHRLAKVVLSLALLASTGSVLAHVLTLIVRVWLGRWPNYADTDWASAMPVIGSLSRFAVMAEFIMGLGGAPIVLLLAAFTFARTFRHAWTGGDTRALLGLSLVVLVIGVVLTFDPFHVTFWMID